jgi:excisionase family DNA binding protein
MARGRKIKSEEPSRSQIMTPPEAAKYLGIHVITLYKLLEKGGVPGFKIGGQWRFKKDLLDAWILKRIEQNNRKA